MQFEFVGYVFSNRGLWFQQILFPKLHLLIDNLITSSAHEFYKLSGRGWECNFDTWIIPSNLDKQKRAVYVT
jgi:hypothetical protein